MWDVVGLLAGGGALLAAGALSTYSGFTMVAIGRLAADDGVRVMRQVNLAAPRSPTFVATLFGPAVLALAVAAHDLVRWDDSGGGALRVVGALVYVVGTVGTTLAFHVPRNTALQVMSDAEAHDGWRRWARSWVGGNHVRVAAGVLAGALLLAGS